MNSQFSTSFNCNFLVWLRVVQSISFARYNGERCTWTRDVVLQRKRYLEVPSVVKCLSLHLFGLNLLNLLVKRSATAYFACQGLTRGAKNCQPVMFSPSTIMANAHALMANRIQNSDGVVLKKYVTHEIGGRIQTLVSAFENENCIEWE